MAKKVDGKKIEEALMKYSRTKAINEIDKIASSGKHKLSAKEFLKIRHEGI